MNTLNIITQDCPFDEKSLGEAVYKKLNQTDNLSVELKFVDEEEIQYLNKTFRNTDRVTDVLSFPMLDGIRYKIIRKEDFKDDYDEDTASVFIGSIAICVKRAKEQAAEYGHSEEREYNYLALHGILHCFNYDHMNEEDEKEMTELAESIMQELKISRSNQGDKI